METKKRSSLAPVMLEGQMCVTILSEGCCSLQRSERPKVYCIVSKPPVYPPLRVPKALGVTSRSLPTQLKSPPMMRCLPWGICGKSWCMKKDGRCMDVHGA